MKYKNQKDNNCRGNFMVATEKLMDKLTVKEFISFLEENAKCTDDEMTYLDGKLLDGKVYEYHEPNSKLRKEFIVTEDGRVLYWMTLMQKIELIDR